MTNYILDKRPSRNRRRKASTSIIIGCHRLRDATLADLLGLLRNGMGAVRDGDDYRVFGSEGYETWSLQ